MIKLRFSKERLDYASNYEHRVGKFYIERMLLLRNNWYISKAEYSFPFKIKFYILTIILK